LVRVGWDDPPRMTMLRIARGEWYRGSGWLRGPTTHEVSNFTRVAKVWGLAQIKGQSSADQQTELFVIDTSVVTIAPCSRLPTPLFAPQRSVYSPLLPNGMFRQNHCCGSTVAPCLAHLLSLGNRGGERLANALITMAIASV
jgi:hypothetical protein